MDHSSNQEKGFFYGYIMAGISLLIMSMMWAGYYAFGVFFKPVLNEFGWTRAMTAGAISMASIMNAMLTIVMGELTDRFGPRMVMTLSGLFLGLGFILMSQIQSLSHLYLSYGLLIGAGMSGAFIPLLSTMARWFDKRRSLFTGIVASGTGIGALFGPPMASRFISLYGWRTSYILLGGVILLGVILLAQLVKKPDESQRIAHQGDTIDLTQNPAVIEGLSLQETLRSPRFWFLFGTGLCYGFCVFSIIVHIVPHAIELKISPIRSANILAMIGGFSILGKILLGRTGDVLGNKTVLLVGFVLMCISFIGWLQTQTPFGLFLSGGIFGFAFGGIAVSHSPLIVDLFGLRSHGLIFGVLNISVMIGAATGPLVTGHLFDLTNSYHLAFWVCLTISLIGIIFTTLLIKKKH